MEAKTNLVAELAAHGVSIQLSVFTRSSLKSWFTIIKANFHVRGISMPDTKYLHAVSKLDADTLEEIQEFLATDRGKDPYQELKEHLCEVFEPTQQQMLDQFLSTTVMGKKGYPRFLESSSGWWRASQSPRSSDVSLHVPFCPGSPRQLRGIQNPPSRISARRQTRHGMRFLANPSL